MALINCGDFDLHMQSAHRILEHRRMMGRVATLEAPPLDLPRNLYHPELFFKVFFFLAHNRQLTTAITRHFVHTTFEARI